jgi:dTDP-4-dehydrorhamnose reductase
LAASGNPIRVVSDSFASPSYAPALAARTIDLVEKGVRGVVHGGGGAPVSWYDYAATIFRLAHVSPELSPILDAGRRTVARRPRFSALKNQRMEELGIEPFPILESAIACYLRAREGVAKATAD